MEKFYKTSIGYARALKSAGVALLLVMFLSVSVDAVHAQGASAQTGKRRITGTITDADGSPLVGATVYIKDTNVGTTTNTEGLFVIDVLPKQQITISYIGYLSQTLPTDGREVFNIKLQSDTDQLEEVVIVGYGKQKRQAMVSSIATVGSRDLMQSSSSNLTSNLAGQLAGLISIQRSAEPGRDDAEFWIRGISTFKGGTNPLVLVDGIPRDINNIEADEIETFSILKDAAATAVYGAEGANGVILVTTKRGTISRPKISFRIEQSIASPQRLPEFVDSWDYLELANEARSNDGLTPSFSAAQIQLYRDRADNDLYPNTQWIDELVRKAVHSQRYTLNFRGGAENAKYFVSMAYYQSDGVFKENPNGKYDSNFGFERYNLRSNIDLKVSKTTRLSVDLSGQYVHRRTANRSADDIFSFMLHTPSYLFPAIYSDGTLASYEKQADSNNRNPYNMLYNQGYRQEWGVKIQSNIKLEQDLKFITPGLSVRGSVSFDYDGSSATLRDYWPSLYHASGRDAEGNLVFTTTSSGSPEISDPKFTSTSYLRKIYIEGAVNYQRTFNYVHNVSAMLLYMQKEQQKNDPVLPYRKQSVVGRVTYSYDNRYFIEGSFGYTGSETFAKKNRFGFFPAVGVSYFVSNEKFYPEGLKKVMNNLKIRLSMGRTGNDDTGTDRFLYRATFNTEGHTFNQGIGTSASNGMGAGIYDLRFVNNDIHWEIETKRNVGLDLGFFDNEIELTADYFNNRRKDILLERNTVPGVAGFHAKPWQNYGIVDNWGVDASLNARHDFGKVRISARGTFTFARNKIVEYDELNQLYDYQRITGTRVNENTLYIAERLYTEDDFIRTQNPNGTYSYELRPGLPIVALQGTLGPGDIKYADLNHDGVIDSNDKKRGVGHPYNPEINYGFGLNVEYKGFYVSAFFQGTGNSSVLLASGNNHFWPFNWYEDKSNYRTLFLDRWTADNPRQDVTMPRLHSHYSHNVNKEASTWWLRSGNFLRFKNLEIGYNLPKTFLRKIRLDAARVYMLGNNLCVWDDIKYWDPEQGNRNNGMSYPMSRTFTLGLEVNF